MSICSVYPNSFGWLVANADPVGESSVPSSVDLQKTNVSDMICAQSKMEIITYLHGWEIDPQSQGMRLNGPSSEDC